MKKVFKSRKGFTLVEMVLVMGIGTYLQKARSAASSAASHNTSISIVAAQIDAELS